MIKRENIISEFWERLYNVSGVTRVVRNPTTPVDLSSLPSINILEREDIVTDWTLRGNMPKYKRRLELAVEAFINGTSEGAATKELMDFVNDIKRAIFADGSSLGGLCEVRERECSDVAIGAGGEHIRAIGLVFDILYVEDVADIFS